MNNISDMLPPPSDETPENKKEETDPKVNAVSEEKTPLEQENPVPNVGSQEVIDQEIPSATENSGDSDYPKDESSQVTQEVTSPSVTTVDPTDSASSTVVAPTETPTNSSNPEPVKRTPAEEAQAITDILLARRAPVGTKANFKLCLYGPPGGTKSSFLNIPNTLIYDQEDGLISLKSWCMESGNPLQSNITAIPFTSFTQADLLLDRLQQRVPELEDVEVFAIDTFNDFYNKALMEIVHKSHRNAPNSVNKWVPETEHYVECNQRMIDFVRKLRDLDRNIIILTHEKTVESKTRGTSIYPDFSESFAKKLQAFMDIVGYIEMRELDGKEVPVVRVKSDGIIHAKTRVPLPTEIANPTYPQLKAAWKKVVDFGDA